MSECEYFFRCGGKLVVRVLLKIKRFVIEIRVMDVSKSATSTG